MSACGDIRAPLQWMRLRLLLQAFMFSEIPHFPRHHQVVAPGERGREGDAWQILEMEKIWAYGLLLHGVSLYFKASGISQLARWESTTRPRRTAT